jgi:hypothetical protein
MEIPPDSGCRFIEVPEVLVPVFPVLEGHKFGFNPNELVPLQRKLSSYTGRYVSRTAGRTAEWIPLASNCSQPHTGGVYAMEK